MKKSIKWTCLLLVIALISAFVPVLVAFATDAPAAGQETRIPIDSRKHLILDANNNYGGTLDAEKYGEGAPLNGEYDQPDSGYWMYNDYYNMTSTADRTVIPHFAPYQQTMKDSGGLACMLMIMNHSGEDVYNTYTEEKLVKMYEEMNDTTVYGNGTSVEGLEKMFNSLGYATRTTDYVEKGDTTNGKIANFNTWLKKHLDAGRFVMVRFQDNVDNGWHIIFGMDTMGTENSRNTILMMADPMDNWDHFQDGYNVSTAGRFYRWWYNVSPAGKVTNQFDYIVVAPKHLVEFDRVEETRQAVQVMPENHMLLNSDGTYGGTTNAELYGVIETKNGETDIPTSQYMAFVDYYNMTSTGTRLILPKYRMFQQTMASSCGICSAMSVMNYYGYFKTPANELTQIELVERYEKLTGSTVKGSGVGSVNLKKMVDSYGFNAVSLRYTQSGFVSVEQSMPFPTYEKFLAWVKDNLSKGTPMPVSWRPHGGHWETIIGIDTMGTDYIYDDVIIFADSADVWDHYQDGYNTVPATLFFRQWYNSSYSTNQQSCVFDNVTK